MCVGEVCQTQVRPDRLGHIGYDVAGRVPRGEDADLRFSLRTNGAVEKPDPRMAPARIGEHRQRIVWATRWMLSRRDVESLSTEFDLGGRQASRGGDFIGVKRW